MRGVIGPSPILPTDKFPRRRGRQARHGFFIMTVLARESAQNSSSRVSRQVDGALVNLRWVLIVLVWVVVSLITANPLPDPFFLVWLITFAVFNGLLAVGVHYKQLPKHLPTFGLAGDILAFSILPLLPSINNPLLILFAIYPTLVAAMRFGIGAGVLVAVLALLPYEGAAIWNFLPDSVRALVPISVETPFSLFAAIVPIVALLGAVFLVGYLAEHERAAAASHSKAELKELRSAMANARLLYETSDNLNTNSYVDMLETMLQAGVSGMPGGRPDSAAPLGMALIFREPQTGEQERTLTVVASRGLDRADLSLVTPGKQGIIAQVLDTGDAISFTSTATDPELAQFSTMRRVRSGVCYPLQSGLEVYGVVIFGTTSTEALNEQHLRLMRAFINQAAIAIQNATLYQNLRIERDHIVEAEASARAKLARDLHDGPTQSVAALAMRLDFIRMLLDRDPSQAKQELEQSREAVMRVGKELRGLLFTLRPLTLETQGLSAALKQYEQRMRDIEHVPLNVQAGNFGTELDPNIAGTVFAIIEEAVNNARKHASGAPIYVSVQRQSGSLLATVRDEGPGFDVNAVAANYSARGSLGMVNMRDRARLIDGKFSLDSAPGRGTQITLNVPLKERAGAP